MSQKAGQLITSRPAVSFALRLLLDIDRNHPLYTIRDTGLKQLEEIDETDPCFLPFFAVQSSQTWRSFEGSALSARKTEGDLRWTAKNICS